MKHFLADAVEIRNGLIFFDGKDTGYQVHEDGGTCTWVMRGLALGNLKVLLKPRFEWRERKYDLGSVGGNFLFRRDFAVMWTGSM